MSVPARTVRIFLSCPGDVTDEKNRLDDVAREAAGVFHEHGLTVTAWRHERDALPTVAVGGAQPAVDSQLPTDYDIYVGIIGSRIGTPTPTAVSGTVEEFEQARARFLSTGKPHILFYFAHDLSGRAGHSGDEQIKKVLEFRQRYPGLYGTFTSPVDLAFQFKSHLFRLLLRECFPISVAHARPKADREWARRLAECLDASAANARPELDASCASVARLQSGLEVLFDLERLTDSERDVLVAADYARNLYRLCLDRDQTLQAIGVALEQTGSQELHDAVVLLSGALTGETRDCESLSASRDIRLALLKALLEIGEAIALQRSAFTKTAPDQTGQITHWLSFLTQSISIRRGLIGYKLLAASLEDAELLKRYIGFRFEILWQKHRRVLLQNYMVLARAPTEVVISPEVPRLPTTLWRRIEAEAARARDLIPDLVHLGEDSRTIKRDAILPIPFTAISHQLSIPVQPEHDYVLSVAAVDSNVPAANEILTLQSQSGSAIVVDATHLDRGNRYKWTLCRDDGFDVPSRIATGEFRTLTDEEVAVWSLYTRAGEPRQTVQATLELWNDVVAETWQSINDDTATLDEQLLVHRILMSSCEWLIQFDPGSPRIDAFRDAANKVRAMFQEN